MGKDTTVRVRVKDAWMQINCKNHKEIASLRILSGISRHPFEP